MASHSTSHGDGHGHGARPGIDVIKHPDLKTYLGTYFALLFLLAVTVVLYYIDFDARAKIVGINLVVALIVASIKAALVVLNFMNVKGGTRLTIVWAGLGFFWLFLMGGIFMDYRMRPPTPGWQYSPRI
jgi:cytochrome c oxidase subunit IV